MMKHLFVLLCCSLSFCEYVMTIHEKDGKEKRIAILDISKITFNKICYLTKEDRALVLPKITSIFLHASPNPTAKLTKISYRLEKKASHQLVIIDLTGNIIKRFGSKSVDNGVCTVEWDGRDDGGKKVGAGHYLVVLKQIGIQRVINLILIR